MKRRDFLIRLAAGLLAPAIEVPATLLSIAAAVIE
jgi:hypothetical protein